MAGKPKIAGVSRFCVTGLLAVAGTSAAAVEYQSVGNDPAILYDAPTLRGGRIAIAPRGMPVEIVVAQNDWTRVRDSTGALAWIERKALVPKRTVVATDPGPIDIHQAPDDSSPVVFRAQPGVLLDLVSPPVGGWVGVRHRDGATGFVRVGAVWGE
jgi:hypothetical protein